MKKPIIVLSSKELQVELSEALEDQGYRVAPLSSMAGLEALIAEHSCRAIVLDLDTIPVDNRFFRNIRKTNPTVHVIVISARPFHPELKEAFLSHIDVCLSKPINAEELFYWLRSIFHDRSSHSRR